MYAVTSMPLVSRTRATLRSAEFGFFGVVVYTRVHTPRRWGEPFSAGVLVFSTLSSRPLRTSWLIVGMGGLDLLPALGRALECVALLVVPGAGPAGGLPDPGRDLPARSQEAVRGDPKVTQAHREREQSQGTRGTAAHSTRAPGAGQNRVPM